MRTSRSRLWKTRGQGRREHDDGHPLLPRARLLRLFRNAGGHQKEIQTKGSLPDRLERAAAVSDNDLLSDTFTTDINNLNQTFAGLQPDELEAAIRLISGAKNIYVLGMRSSFSLAHYMVSRLGEIKKTCTSSSSPA